MRCSVCTGELVEFGQGQVLSHLQVTYFRCEDCGLVLLPSPTWLDRAYSDAISDLDVGLLSRCLTMARLTRRVMRYERVELGLDWAGGYGTLTRLMRDSGHEFMHYDPYCANVFAQAYVGALDQRYGLVTAFEVIEHLPEPVESLTDVAACSDLVLFSTLLLPDPAPAPGTWWYYAPESGQHVAFHTTRSLRALGEQLGYGLLSNGANVHLFHRGRPSPRTRLLLSSAALRLNGARRRAQQSVRALRHSPQSLLDADAQRAQRSHEPTVKG